MPNLKPTRGAEINRMHPLSRGLAGLWILNEGTGSKIFDASGNRYTGTLTGMDPATDWVAGPQGPALDFDGDNDYIKVDSPGTFAFPDQTFTISVWLFTHPGPWQRGIAGVRSSQGGWTLFYEHNAPDYPVGFRYFQLDGSEAGAFQLEGINLIDGRWHHLVVVMTTDTVFTTGNEGIMYLDGVEMTVNRNRYGPYGSPPDNLRIGISSVNYWNGQLDNIAIYDRGLSATEVTLLHRDPFCMFGRVA